MNKNKLIELYDAITNEVEGPNVYWAPIQNALYDARKAIVRAIGYCTLDERDCQRFAEADAAIQKAEGANQWTKP